MPLAGKYAQGGIMPKKKSVTADDAAGIGHKLKLSYFIASVIPIAVTTYIYLVYISPEAQSKGQYLIPIIIAVMLVLTVILSLLGLTMTTKAANDSIKTLTKLNHRMDSLLDLTKNFRESFWFRIFCSFLIVIIIILSWLLFL